MADRIDSIEGRAVEACVMDPSILSCRSEVLVLEAEVFRLDLKKPGFCVGLAEVFWLRLDQVADAGSFGGGILSYRAASESFPEISDNLVSLVLLWMF